MIKSETSTLRATCQMQRAASILTRKKKISSIQPPTGSKTPHCKERHVVNTILIVRRSINYSRPFDSNEDQQSIRKVGPILLIDRSSII